MGSAPKVQNQCFECLLYLRRRLCAVEKTHHTERFSYPPQVSRCAHNGEAGSSVLAYTALTFSCIP